MCLTRILKSLLRQNRNSFYSFFLTRVIFLALTAGFVTASASLADELKMMSWNVSKVNTYAGYETERIIQGLEPDIALLQEWIVDTGEFTDTDDWVDQSFGTGFDYYRGSGIEGAFCMKNGIVSRWEITSSGSWTDNYVSQRYYDWAEITLPGGAILQVVSIHLHSSDEPTRILEIKELIGYIEANFSNSHYLVIGGDFNTSTRSSEPIPTLLDDANWTGSCWVTISDGTPQDKNGDSDTNVNRGSNYDWLIPNTLLGNEIMSLNLGGDGDPYTGGIVFDSRVFTPLSAVSPILYGDTANGDQDHCPAMKSYDILADSVSAGDVVINEIAWMGTTASASDEWIEFYNTTGSSIDIANWSIYGADNGVTLNFSDADGNTTTIIPAGGYLIYANDSAVFSSGATENIWDATIDMLNSSGQLILYSGPNATGVTVDTANDAGTWFAGTSTGYITMERIDPAASGTSASNWDDFCGTPFALDTGSNNVNGSPGTQNSVYSGSGSGTVKRINFQPIGATEPSPEEDWMEDWGQNYGDEGQEGETFGW